jgi:hypothetical protein
MIIGLCGFIGSGKDTAAKYLVNKGFQQESFAGTLKDTVSAIFGWDRELLEGKTPEARLWREQVDPWWADRLAMPTLTPRWVLQYIGTDVFRNHFHGDIWIASLEKKLVDNKHNDIVISDCRFPNEVKVIQDLGGKVAWVKRGELPDWYDIATDACNGHKIAIQEMDNLDVHPSEWAWLLSDFDFELYNEHTLDYLYQQVESRLINDRELDLRVSI